MTVDEARAFLQAEGYVPGVSNTKRIRGEKRQQIKLACRVLKDAGVTIEPPAPKPAEKKKS